jgi:hypothetical protein
LKQPSNKSSVTTYLGRGQLTLVEHALCPLDPQASLVENLVHEASYGFMDRSRNWRKAHARVFCPLGLSANDEFYLWGLLALTFAEDGSAEFHATPHFCLSRLGVIDTGCRSGRHYQLFGNSMERLSAVHYQNDHFYDPIRGEHRKVSFGFFSYSLPLDPKSNRAWRIAWDPIFFEFAKASSGYLRFDLEMYRNLDPATRRMFLLLSKIFYRKSVTPSFELRSLAEGVLGICPRLCARDLKRKVSRCVQELQARGIVGGDAGTIPFRKRGPGQYVLSLSRGPYFEDRRMQPSKMATNDSALFEPLGRIGLTETTMVSLIRKYPAAMLREWTDITLAAMERKGTGFFKKSPAAYLLDNLKHAVKGTRTVPDWWLDVRKAEFEYSGRKRVSKLPVLERGGPSEGVCEILSRMVKEGGLSLPIKTQDPTATTSKTSSE